jgi:hypothetical protein
MKKMIIKFFQKKGIVVYLNQILRSLTKSSIEYQLIKLADSESVKSFFKLIHPVNAGHELIRIGPNHDGGYLLPNDLIGINYCFSPGVGGSILFEENLLDFGIESFLLDPSVVAPSTNLKGIHFEQKPLTPATGDLFSFKMFDDLSDDIRNEKGISLHDWVNSKATSTDADLILQLDIENSEYQVLLATPIDLLKKFRIMAIEFHSFHNLRYQYNLDNIFFPLFTKILSEFDIVHIHPNNVAQNIPFSKFNLPHALEITFHRRDRRISSPTKLVKITNDLDFETVKGVKKVFIDERLFE